MVSEVRTTTASIPGLQESFKIKERYHAIVAVEAFNLFNHSNYGNFAVNASYWNRRERLWAPYRLLRGPVRVPSPIVAVHWPVLVLTVL